MNYDLLEAVTKLLTADGIPAGEEYPALEQPEIHSVRAAVGLRELDTEGWTARICVRVLSPRILGGWYCQAWASRTTRALNAGGLVCRAGEMEYNSGCDCFCVPVETVVAVVPTADGWEPGSRWQILCGNAELRGVVSFKAVRDQQRRLVGTHWKSEPVSVSPGIGGWKLELVQMPETEPDPVTEPFVLTVQDGNQCCHYTGCCWNETVWEYTQSGTRLTRRGFALGREEDENGG